MWTSQCPLSRPSIIKTGKFPRQTYETITTIVVVGNVEKIKELLDEMKTKNIEKIFMNYSELMMAQLKW